MQKVIIDTYSLKIFLKMSLQYFKEKNIFSEMFFIAILQYCVTKYRVWHGPKQILINNFNFIIPRDEGPSTSVSHFKTKVSTPIRLQHHSPFYQFKRKAKLRNILQCCFFILLLTKKYVVIFETLNKIYYFKIHLNWSDKIFQK